MSLSGTLAPQVNDAGRALSFSDTDGNSVLSYGGLRAWDSTGRDLPARLEVRALRASGGARIAILVDDAAARYPVTIDPLLTQVAKLTASDAAPGDFFGVSVAIAGDTAVVGAQLGDGAVSDSGSAYVFGRNQGGTDNWGQVAKLTALDGAPVDRFGRSVAIAGETVVVGALGDDDAGGASGSAYVFGRNEGGADNWGQVAKLTASDAAGDDIFGFSVAIAGETVVVGASFNDHAGGTDAGSAYVFGLGLEVPIDIKPGSCPNPLNVKSEGVLPVGILGTEDFDATDVDPTTVLLAGVPMLIFDYEDVATPFEPFVSKEEATDCNDGGPDGFEDITLKFDTQAIVGAISPVDDGDVVVLPLEGELFDGTPIVGEDVVVIRKKGE
ncbi:MAG: FG-GAP repeat protein [Nitrospinae bacterium]|nr:FG-GAP repeat protein [Nitrospinota bacterium]